MPQSSRGSAKVSFINLWLMDSWFIAKLDLPGESQSERFRSF